MFNGSGYGNWDDEAKKYDRSTKPLSETISDHESY